MMRYLILIVVYWRIALSSIATKYIPDNRTINNTAATPIRAGHVVHVLPVACSSDCLDAPAPPGRRCSPAKAHRRVALSHKWTAQPEERNDND